ACLRDISWVAGENSPNRKLAPPSASRGQRTSGCFTVGGPLRQKLRHTPNLRLGVQSRDEKTQTRLVFRHPDLNDRRHIIAVFHQMTGRSQSLMAVGE